MSWSFSSRGHPKEVRARADAYFASPYIGTMETHERLIALNAHAQIISASENAHAGFDLVVNAYGSASVYSDDGTTLQRAQVEISYEAVKAAKEQAA